MHHHAGCQLAAGFLFALRKGKAHRFQHAHASAVLCHAFQIHHLIERQGCRLTLQAAFAFRAPGALGTYLALDHCLARQQLYLPHGGAAGNIQNGCGRLCKHKLPFHSDQLFQHRGAAHAVQRLQFLFNAAIGQRRDQFLFILCMDSNHKTIGSAHLDAVRVYRPAVEVFSLPFYHGHPAGEGKFRHLQLLCKRQLLLGLAKPGPILALIKHSAAQIAFQCKPPGLQLLLQHHRFCKAFDQLEHRRKII